jgi:hypothetical protein
VSSVTRQRTVPVLLAVLCILVLAMRVDLDFERVRIRVPIGSPPAGDRVALDVPDLTRLAGVPAALVVQATGGATPADLEVRFDGTVVGRTRLAAGGRTRIDAGVQPRSRERHVIQIIGTAPGWRLREVEVSSVHGHARGALALNIVPAARSADWPIPASTVVPLALLLLAGRPRWEWPARAAARVAHRMALAGVVAFLLAVLTAHWFSPYGVLLGPQAWLLTTAVVYAERLTVLGRAVLRRTTALAARPRALLPHLVVAVFFLSCVAYFYDRASGFTSLVSFGHGFAESRHPALRDMQLADDPEMGYDGQFYAQLAVDPLVLDEATVEAMDAPGYRARRPLAPAIAHVIGLGHPWYAVQAYAVLNVVCWLLLGWLLLHWLPPGRAAAAAAWTACMLSGGLLASVVRALIDGPSVVILVLAVLAVERGRQASGAAALGFAILGRDSHIVGGGLLAGPERRWTLGSLAWHAMLVVVPLALWLVYLIWVRDISPFDAGHRNFAPPLVGFIGRWGEAFAEVTLTSVVSLGVSGLTTMIGLTVQAIVLLARPNWRDPWWRVGAGYVVLLCVLGASVWEGHPVAAARTLLPMTLAFNILLLRGRWSWPLWFAGNLHVFEGLLLLMPWLQD